MARLLFLLPALVIGSAIIAQPASAQHGSSVSLTHTLTVTVPPRVKVQLAPVAPIRQSAMTVSSSQPSTNGIALSISATRGWTLSIGSAGGKGKHEWSLESGSGFAPVTTHNTTVVNGVLSQTPVDATVFLRKAASAASADRINSASGSDAVLLTIVAP
ncbi:MAG: hypothetical protein ACJ78D_01790 [Gemmatimonadaceae bacterium]